MIMCAEPIKLREVESSPSEHLIKQLEDMLNLAKAGELRSLVSSEVFAGGVWGYRVAGDLGEEMTHLATLQVVQAVMIRAIFEAVIEEPEL